MSNITEEGDGRVAVDSTNEANGGNYKKEKLDNKYLYTPAAILIAGFFISGSILYSGSIAPSGAPSGSLAAQVVTGELAQPTEPTEEYGGGPALTITEDDHIRGNPNASVTIVEFSDFQCPFCQRFHPTVAQALLEYGDDVRWVYRHFPLSQIHAEAIASAEASECVAEQRGNEGFWQFADTLFENQARLSPAFYREAAEGMAVDLAQFDICVAERKYKEKVEEHQSIGIQVGITGTPGGFVNNQPIRGAIPYAQLKSIIDSELE